MSENDFNFCSECNSHSDLEQNGFLVCKNCGTVKDRSYVDQLPSYSGNGEDKVIHTSIGKNINFVGALGSQIGYSSGYLTGHKGRRLKLSTINRYQRLIKVYHKKAQYDGNATHLRTMIAFTRVFNSLDLSASIKSRTLYLYWKYVKMSFRVTNHVLLVALCLLKATREGGEKAPIRFHEIIRSFADHGHRVTNKNILKLARDLNISLAPSRRKSEDYIPRITSKLTSSDIIRQRLLYQNLSPEQYEAALILLSQSFLQRLDRKERGGVQPFAFAVSVIYLADRSLARSLRRKPILTQRNLAKASGSAEFTIRDHVYRFLGKLYKLKEPELIRIADKHLKKLQNNSSQIN